MNFRSVIPVIAALLVDFGVIHAQPQKSDLTTVPRQANAPGSVATAQQAIDGAVIARDGAAVLLALADARLDVKSYAIEAISTFDRVERAAFSRLLLDDEVWQEKDNKNGEMIIGQERLDRTAINMIGELLGRDLSALTLFDPTTRAELKQEFDKLKTSPSLGTNLANKERLVDQDNVSTSPTRRVIQREKSTFTPTAANSHQALWRWASIAFLISVVVAGLLYRRRYLSRRG